MEGHIKYSKGVCWIGDCRIPFVDEGDKSSAKPLGKTLKHKGWDTEKWLEETKEPHTKGRFTPNLLVCDDMLNDGKITKKTTSKITQVGIGRGVIGNHDGRKTITKAKEGMEMLRSVGDGGTNSRFYDLDLWFDKMIERL